MSEITVLPDGLSHLEDLNNKQIIIELEENMCVSTVVDENEIINPISWPDPSPEDLNSSEFETIWQIIKTWDINVPEAYNGYCGASGNHVKAILDALSPASE